MPDHIYELISYGHLPSGRATEVRRISEEYTPKFLLPLSAIQIEERFMVKISSTAGQGMMRVRIPDHIARSRGLDPTIDAPREGWEIWTHNPPPVPTPEVDHSPEEAPQADDDLDPQLSL